MTTFDAADLLSDFNRKSGSPAASTITPDSKYDRLTKSQNRVVAMIAGVAPNVLYPQVSYARLPTLTTTDSQCFTFGYDDNDYPMFPMGRGGIFPSLTAIPHSPWVEGRDFISEGTSIRIPNNGTYTGALYWYGIMNPPDITATSQPVLFPEASRELIVIDAVRQFATEFNRNPSLAALMQAEWNTAWPTWALVWRTQFRSGGALRWSGRQLALASQSSL